MKEFEIGHSNRDDLRGASGQRGEIYDKLIPVHLPKRKYKLHLLVCINHIFDFDTGQWVEKLEWERKSFGVNKNGIIEALTPEIAILLYYRDILKSKSDYDVTIIKKEDGFKDSGADFMLIDCESDDHFYLNAKRKLTPEEFEKYEREQRFNQIACDIAHERVEAEMKMRRINRGG